MIDKEGYILTNNHVVQGADQLTVTLIDGKSFKGKVIGLDPRTDLAVIKIKSATNFPFVPLGDSSKVRIGDWAIAVGSPFGLEQTLTVGVISAIRQSLSIEGKTFKNLLQTDAAINRGNSGGPMVNISGQLIGINTAIYAPTGVFSGIGFAIPVNDAKVVIKDLIEKGFVERSWMGVEIAPVDEVIASQFGLSDTKGALVNQVVPNSPASKAGLKRGDIVLEFDGKKIDKVQTLQDLVSAANPGRTVSIKVLRDGSSKFLKLTTAVMPKQENMSELKNNDDDSSPSESLSQVEWLGAQFSNLNNMLRQNYKIDDAIEGVLLIDLPAQCLAVEAGLLEGDVVRAVNRKEVGNVQDLKKLEKTLDEKKGFVLDVVRRGRSFYLSYKTLQ
ncbi:MAG: Do family serine endopeptidase [Elusimicrobiota bacterium]